MPHSFLCLFCFTVSLWQSIYNNAAPQKYTVVILLYAEGSHKFENQWLFHAAQWTVSLRHWLLYMCRLNARIPFLSSEQWGFQGNKWATIQWLHPCITAACPLGYSISPEQSGCNCVLGAKAFLFHTLLVLFLHSGDQQDHPDHHHPLLHKVILSKCCEGAISLPLGHPACSESGPGSHNSWVSAVLAQP